MLKLNVVHKDMGSNDKKVTAYFPTMLMRTNREQHGNLHADFQKERNYTVALNDI